MPAESAVGRRPHGIGADLAGEIHLNRRIDGHHPVVLRDHERIVGVLRGMEFEDRVVVDEVEDALRPQHKARDYFAPVQRLAVAGDDAGLDQRHRAIGAHLAVNAEILPVE